MTHSPLPTSAPIFMRQWLPFLFVMAVWVVCLCGCASEVENVDQDVNETAPQHPISVVVVDAADLSEPIQRQWAAQTGGEVQIENVSIEELFADNYAAIDNADVLIYPSVLLAHLVADEVVSELLDEVWDSEQLDNKGLLSVCRTDLIRFGRDRWATPLSHPHTLFFLRNDVLEKLGAQVPETWEELVQLKQQIDSNKNELDAASLPTSVVLPTQGNDVAYMTLAIAAAEIRHRGKLDSLFQRATMKPLIATQPYFKALNALKSLTSGDSGRDVVQAARHFCEGNAAVAIGWPIKASFEDANSLVNETVLEQTVVTRLPGTKQWFDFGTDSWNQIPEGTAQVELIGHHSYQASILKTASYPTSVNRFVSWLSSKSATNQIVSYSLKSGPTRYSQLGDIQNWTGDIFSVDNADRLIEMLNEINDENITMTFPRIRGSHEYISVLTAEIQSFLNGQSDAEAALQSVAQQWEAITQRYGREQQMELLRTDLGF